MENVFNFRDLGGIPTKDGKKIKSGLFFRSGLLDFASDNDVTFLKSFGLKEIFDYRDRDEVDKDKEYIYKNIGAKHLHYPNDIKKGMVYKLQSGGVERIFMKIKPSDVCEFYSYLPFGNDGYKNMIEALKRGDVPFLQHCTAGKDRAGIGSALLLAVLGASYDEIVKDYLESLKIRDNIRKVMFDKIPKIVHPFIKNSYEPLFIVDKIYIDSARDAILKKYGSFENYLLKEYGLTQLDVDEIRAKYTE